MLSILCCYRSWLLLLSSFKSVTAADHFSEAIAAALFACVNIPPNSFSVTVENKEQYPKSCWIGSVAGDNSSLDSASVLVVHFVLVSLS